jgi:hypothetical protein
MNHAWVDEKYTRSLVGNTEENLSTQIPGPRSENPATNHLSYMTRPLLFPWSLFFEHTTFILPPQVRDHVSSL